jgi:hypothetical protein
MCARKHTPVTVSLSIARRQTSQGCEKWIDSAPEVCEPAGERL